MNNSDMLVQVTLSVTSFGTMLAFERAGSGVSSNMSSHVSFTFHSLFAKFVGTLVRSIADPNGLTLKQNEIAFSLVFQGLCISN